MSHLRTMLDAMTVGLPTFDGHLVNIGASVGIAVAPQDGRACDELLRWRHPERGLVSPLDFIPLADAIDLIVPLGEWVVREACREATRWPDGVSVAVKVSPYQFEDPERLTRMVAGSLATSGLPGNRLEIEITESVLLRNEASVLTSLHQLRATDVRVAMDDFGTGYSSSSVAATPTAGTPSSARSRHSEPVSASRRSPRASRRPTSSRASAPRAAPRFRVTCSAARFRSIRWTA